MLNKMLAIGAVSTVLFAAGADAQEFPDGTVFCGALGVLHPDPGPCSTVDIMGARIYVPAGGIIGVYQDDDGGGKADPSKDGQASSGGGTNWGGGWWGYLPKNYGKENDDYNDVNNGMGQYGGWDSKS